MPISKQQEILQSAQNKITPIESQSSLARSGVEDLKRNVAQLYNTPLPSAHERAERLWHYHTTKSPESGDSTEEKKELLDEIKQIKGQIQSMILNLNHEISGSIFGKDLTTQKRNALLILSRSLYVSANPSLSELQTCIEKFKVELAKCQKDTVLNQGIMRKNCRTLIKGLSQEIADEQHVFNRLKR